MPAVTSTYLDATQAVNDSGWIFIGWSTGYDLTTQPDPSDLTTTDHLRRQHFVLIRTRTLKQPIVVTNQLGQIGIGQELGSSLGTITGSPPGIDPDDLETGIGFLCTEHEMDLHEQGTDIVRITQVWEHWARWVIYDPDNLRDTA